MFFKLIKQLINDFSKYITPAVIFAVLMMFFVILISEIGLKKAVVMWIKRFKRNKKFRWQFVFFVYLYMIAEGVLFSRALFSMKPFSRLMNGWLIEKNGDKYNFESVNNILLFIPYIFLFYAAFFDRDSKYKNKDIILNAAILSLFSSLIIELLQTVFCLGTLQFSDIVYNTLGGIIGVILFQAYLLVINKFTKSKIPSKPKRK